MTRANWKAVERAVAKRMGVTTTRNTRPGTWEDAGDIALPGWCVEVKAHDAARWTVQKWWQEIDAKAARGSGDRPALVLFRPRRPLDDALVIVRFGDVAALAAQIDGGERV